MRARLPHLPPPFRWPKTNQYLYHYTTAEAALRFILPTQTLRANCFPNMNDPREAKRWTFEFAAHSIINDMEPLQQVEYLRQNKLIAHEAARIAQASTRVIAFCQDNFKRHINSRAVEGRGFGHSAMWAHYAGRHAGICLIFDRERLLTSLAKDAEAHGAESGKDYYFGSGDVIYEDGPLNITKVRSKSSLAAPSPLVFDPDERKYDPYNPSDLRGKLNETVLQHLKDHANQLFFRKSVDWSYEQEFRFIMWAKGDQPILLNFEDALAGIIVGEDFGATNALGDFARPAYLIALERLCHRLKVRAYELRWENGGATINPATQKHDKKRWSPFAEEGAKEEDFSAYIVDRLNSAAASVLALGEKTDLDDGSV